VTSGTSIRDSEHILLAEPIQRHLDEGGCNELNLGGSGIGKTISPSATVQIRLSAPI